MNDVFCLAALSRGRLGHRILCSLSLTAVMVMGGVVTAADEDDKTKSLVKGDPIGAFRVVKVAGANEDGVQPGDTLCYRCRYGSSPMVMVFARKSSTELVSLVRQLDQAVEQNEEERLRSFVIFVGQEVPQLKELAEQLSTEVGPTSLPIVVSQDAKTGPPEYHLSASADATVIVAQDSQVVAIETFSGKPIVAAQIMSHLNTMLTAPAEET